MKNVRQFMISKLSFLCLGERKGEQLKPIGIKNIPDNQRPFEKYQRSGASSLSDSELLAMILRTGSKDHDILSVSNDIIKLCDEGKNLSSLIRLCEQDLRSVKGVGRIKAAQLICIGELAKRIAWSKAERLLSFTDPGTIAEYYMERLRYLQQEHIVISMLDSKNRLIKDKVISIGSVNATLASPREIFKEALKYNAVSIVVLHNHPSGDSAPSKEDVEITDRLAKVGSLLNLKVLDHIIIGDREYYSFKEKGIIT